ncbi:hypothetical protein Avbf_09619 [Armadillidium vulgare]|nr:hypothetical protein Avbf_09619 [Armadillidium vulgare]
MKIIYISYGMKISCCINSRGIEKISEKNEALKTAFAQQILDLSCVRKKLSKKEENLHNIFILEVEDR